ncbi:Iron-dependent repressor IdeR [Pirellulimonas nuda]|uniref:Transcriptional regulator MntR n=1 Tax=Pirellulimonas nuda TaxID=2528009 RepID=A0A518DJW4_9BACT|nr:metal-dependent transcriptional regulator [Pirellulimonas nuda]QDU91768.1 Iron-dependent repressor IdeR [Pirellulimonas nuda]
MPSLTVENYLKAILALAEPDGAVPDAGGDAAGDGSAPVSTGRIATALGVSPGTVTSMLKTLDEGGLIAYAPYSGARLTRAGRAIATRVVRRHRLIELFLVQTLGLSWDEVHDEAEHMEHAVSDALVERIDAFLGRPEVDPHGSPIPSADGAIAATADHRLDACDVGQRFEVVRVDDQSPETLRGLSEAGLLLGVVARLTRQKPLGCVVEIDGAPVALDAEQSAAVFVRVLG